VLGLDDDWISVRAERIGRGPSLDVAPVSGMSESPILDNAGAALGVLKLGRPLDKPRDHRLPREVGSCPGQAAFWDCLPQWLCRSLRTLEQPECVHA